MNSTVTCPRRLMLPPVTELSCRGTCSGWSAPSCRALPIGARCCLSCTHGPRPCGPMAALRTGSGYTPRCQCGWVGQPSFRITREQCEILRQNHAEALARTATTVLHSIPTENQETIS